MAQMQRDNMFREQMFGETMHINKSLVASLQETNHSTLQAIQMITSMVGPLLESKDRENRKLKRMLSERYGMNGEDDILLGELGARRKRQKIVQPTESDDGSGGEDATENDYVESPSQGKKKASFKPVT